MLDFWISSLEFDLLLVLFFSHPLIPAFFVSHPLYLAIFEVVYPVSLNHVVIEARGDICLTKGSPYCNP